MSCSSAEVSTCEITTYLSPQSGQPLLLSMRINVGTNYERDDIEEGDPSVLGQELLGKRQSQWRRNPADFHDRHEAGPDGSSDLVEGPRASNDSH